MPYTNNGNIQITYEIHGEGEPLVLQHGLTSNMSRWINHGYVEALKDQFTVITIDARGHGRSDKPYQTEANDRKLMASDIIAVLDAEDIQKSHYMGYSMGGSIGFGIAESFSERVHSIIIGGMHPYPMNNLEMTPGVKALDGMIELLKDGMESYVESMNPQPDHERRRQLLANDHKSIIAATLALKNRPDLSHVLPTMTMPCLVYAGDADGLHAGAEECAKHIPSATWISLPGLDHGEAMDRSDLVLPHLTGFLSSVSV